MRRLARKCSSTRSTPHTRRLVSLTGPPPIRLHSIAREAHRLTCISFCRNLGLQAALLTGASSREEKEARGIAHGTQCSKQQLRVSPQVRLLLQAVSAPVHLYQPRPSAGLFELYVEDTLHSAACQVQASLSKLQAEGLAVHCSQHGIASCRQLQCIQNKAVQ